MKNFKMDEDGRINDKTLLEMVPKPFKELVRPIVEKCLVVGELSLIT